MSVARAAATQLAWPVSWYATWVRAHPDNAKQLERLAQTVAMVVSDPGNLINMEGYWSLSKLYAYLNETLMHTAGRRVPAAEVTAYVLHVVQEVECLVELALRKYRGHRAAWNALLGLAAVKCVLNLCVHRQFFLVRWVCTALTLSLRRWRLRLMHGSQRLLQLRWLQRRRDSDGVGGGVDSSSARMRAGQNGKMTTRRATTTAAAADTLHMRKLPAPGGAPLVVPRVMSSRTRVTQLRVHEQQHLLQRQQHAYRQLRSSDDDNANDVDDNDKPALVVVATNGELVRVGADEAQLARDEAASVPFTWIDALGMTVDAYLLLRPVLLIGSARHLFLRRSSRRWRDDAHDGRVDEVVQPRLALTATTAADGGEERMQMAHAAVTAAPHASLFASWKLWCAFTLLDLVVVLLSRFIRKRRVPIVYVGATHDESSNGSVTAVAPASHDALAAAEQQHNNTDEDDKDAVSAAKGASGAGNGHDIDVRNGSHHHHHDHNNGEHAVVPTHHDATATTTNGVVPAAAAAAALVTPAVVSRDSLRVQHALRNLVVGFLRDPFFSAVLKRYLYTHFVQGTINKVPLLGPLLGFQVGYFLAMQHYSFLYSAGQ